MNRTPPRHFGLTSIEFTHEFDTTLWTAGKGSVELNLSATDTVGNVIYAEEEVKGAIGKALEALSEIWSAIAGVLSGVAEAVAETVSAFVDRVEMLIEDRIMHLFHTILSAIGNYVNCRIYLKTS